MVEHHLAPIRVRDDPGKDNPAPYREPVELACFSKSRAHGTTYDKSMLKQYLRPSVPFDLSVGYSTFVDRDRGVQRPALLDPIFGALRHANVLEKELACADVVTWRGNFAKLLATPWNTRDPWHMECERVDGVLVLNVLEPTQLLEKERKKDKQGREAKMCYWGFSFEERCVGGAGAYGEPIDCANCFCAVVRAGVGAHRLVLGGEVDCWDGEKHGLAGYVELKTTRVMDTQGQVKNFERDKLLKWWAQSFAVGVRRILVGFRDDSGHVQKLQTLDTLKLPGYAARHNGAWDPKTALRFADRVLTELRGVLEGLPVGTRVRLEYDPKRTRDEVRVVVDELIPDFVPAEARGALARAAVLRAAGGGATSSGGRSGSKSRGSGGGGSVGGGGSGGAGSVGGGGRVIGGGTAASAKRGVVFREPEPPRGHRGCNRSERFTVTGTGGGRGPAGYGNDAKNGVSLGGPGSTPGRVGHAGGDGNPGGDPSPKKSGSPSAAPFSFGPTDAARHGGGAPNNATPSSATDKTAPVERFVHWGAGGSTDSGAGTGGASHSHHERRRRRRHERSQTPVPGVTRGGGGGVDENDGLRFAENHGAPPEIARDYRTDPRVPDGIADPDRIDRDRPSDRDRAHGVDRSNPSNANDRSGDLNTHKQARTFRHPIVAGPGVGDPFGLAASKLAYARSLGPTAMRYLMGFTPGHTGLPLPGGDEPKDDGIDTSAKRPGIGGDGVSRDSLDSAGGQLVGAVKRQTNTDHVVSMGKHDTDTDQARGGSIPAVRDETETDAFDKDVGLDPRLFAFDPSRPTKVSSGTPPPTVFGGAEGSEGDGQQSSFVSAGNDLEGGTAVVSRARRGVGSSRVDADVAGSDAETSAGEPAGPNTSPGGSRGARLRCAPATTATSVNAADDGEDETTAKRARR